MSNWAARNSCLWGWFFLVLELGPAQDAVEYLDWIRGDAETPVPEEDLLSLEFILAGRRGLADGVLQELAGLSFIDEDDYRQIKSIARAGDPVRELNRAELSPAVRRLLEIIIRRMAPARTRTILQQIISGHGDGRYLWRLERRARDLEAGLLMERDPGEMRLDDRISGYCRGQSRKQIQWLAGDHQLLLGYGLLMWRATPPYLSFDTPRRAPAAGKGLEPFRSRHEEWGLRGMAIQIPVGQGRGVLSLSRNRHYGSLQPNGEIRLQVSGIHTPLAGGRSRDILQEDLVVAGWQTGGAGHTAGVVTAGSRWQSPSGSGEQYQAASVYGSMILPPVRLFGEYARGYGPGRGLLLGAQIRAPRFLYLVLGRHYGARFRGPRSGPPASGGGSEYHEQGIYQGLEFRLAAQRVHMFSDLFRVPGGEPANGPGEAYGIQWESGARARYQRIQFQETSTISAGKPAYVGAVPSPGSRRRRWKCLLYRSWGVHWGLKLQVQRVTTRTGRTDGAGWGGSVLLQGRWEQTRLDLEWVTLFSVSQGTPLYFWELNLPREMRSRRYGKSGHYPGARMLLKTTRGFTVSARFRSDLSRRKVLDCGLAIEAML